MLWYAFQFSVYMQPHQLSLQQIILLCVFENTETDDKIQGCRQNADRRPLRAPLVGISRHCPDASQINDLFQLFLYMWYVCGKLNGHKRARRKFS